MKQKKFPIIIVFAIFGLMMLSILSCKKENDDLLVGKWKLVKSYSIMGGEYFPSIQDQRIEEYTKKNRRILYDFEGNEIARSNFSATNSSINIYGANLNGEEWNFNMEYWITSDTLRLRQNGGFEHYDEFLIRIE